MNRQEEIKYFFEEARGLLAVLKFEPKLGELVRLREIVGECVDGLGPNRNDDEPLYNTGNEAFARFFWERYDIPADSFQRYATSESIKQLGEYLKIKQEEMHLL